MLKSKICRKKPRTPSDGARRQNQHTHRPNEADEKKKMQDLIICEQQK